MTVQKDISGSIVLDNIPVNISISRVLERLRMPGENERVKKIVLELISAVEPIARPKAIYKTALADTKNRKTIVIDGIELTSYVPSLKFGAEEIVFPYVATCGLEIDTYRVEPGEFMKRYSLNIIKEMILRSTSEYLRNYIIKEYKMMALTHIGPGEALGPIAQQQELFSILGDVEKLIGVRLSAHNMMVPEKSISGIFFETTARLESCQLCPDMKCSARRYSCEPALLKQHRSKPSVN
ncbi:hypothetical protein ACFLYN_05215 [Chloroflexota bacterium]